MDGLAEVAAGCVALVVRIGETVQSVLACDLVGPTCTSPSGGLYPTDRAALFAVGLVAFAALACDEVRRRRRRR